MNRRHFLWTTVTAATGMAASPGLFAAEKAKPVALGVPVPGAPFVTAPTGDGVTVVWGVTSPCTGYVEYGDTPELGRIAYGGIDGLRPFDTHVLSVRLTGLKPGARVHYRTVTAPIAFPNHYSIKRGEAVASPVFDFVLPDASTGAKIAVWNDIHQQKPTVVALNRLTEEFSPSLLVWNGDMVADQFNKESDFHGPFLEPAEGVAPASKRVLYFVRGNHDARGSIARDLPKYAPRALADGYHNFLRIGQVAILSLDTGDDKEGPAIYGGMGDFAAYREHQLAWLKTAVTQPDYLSAPFKILLCHIPLRWKTPKEKGAWCSDGDARWSETLAKAGIRAVISGHTHEFWHDAPNPERPFHQIVSGGPQIITSGWSPTPASAVLIEADAGKMTIRVVEADSRKELLSLAFDA